MKRRDLLKFGSACFAAKALMSRRALAQSTYPERPIKLVIPFAPGGVTDIIGRLWADRVKLSLGSVFVENQGGAGGSIGRTTVGRANPDGYTLLLGGGSQTAIAIATNPSDPAKDVAPISILVVAALVIAAHPSVPARNLSELIDLVRAG